MSFDPIAAARRVLAASPGWADREADLRPAVTPIASPMNQGIDAVSLRAVDRTGGGSVWIKVTHPEARLFADPTTAAEAASHAARLGVGPRVLAADPEGVLVMEDLAATHRVATLATLNRPAVRDGVLSARRRLHAGPRLSRTRSVFDHVEELVDKARTSGAPLPQDSAWLLDNVRAAAAAVAAGGVDTVPAHGDGNASNVLVDEAEGILLVDYDMAANMDPFEDLGSFIVEAHAFDPPARESFEVFYGRFDERLFNRARLYGVADDLRWGLIGALLAHSSGRRDLEFLKYADWRFLRCRMAMRDPRFEERLRRT